MGVLAERAPAAGVAERPGESSTGKSGSWRDLRLRLISAAVAAPVGLFCVWFGGPLWLVMTVLVAIGLAWEWAALCRTKFTSTPGTLFAVGIGLGALDWLLVDDDSLLAALLPAVVAGVFLIALYRNRRGVELAIGCLWILLATLSLIWLRFGGPTIVIMLLLTVWASDSGAYLVGRWLGGPKLAPSISPGKTRTGAVGGLLAAMAVCGLSAAIAGPTALAPSTVAAIRLVSGLGLGALFGVVSQFGDLAESAFKRRCGAKDSGRLIPGHGGLLDRLDGLIAVAPVAVATIFAISLVTSALSPSIDSEPRPQTGPSITGSMQ